MWESKVEVLVTSTSLVLSSVSVATQTEAKSISDLTFTEERNSIPEMTVCGTVTISVLVT